MDLCRRQKTGIAPANAIGSEPSAFFERRVVRDLLVVNGIQVFGKLGLFRGVLFVVDHRLEDRSKKAAVAAESRVVMSFECSLDGLLCGRSDEFEASDEDSYSL